MSDSPLMKALYRKFNVKTQKELAHKLGKTNAELSRWRKSKKEISPLSIATIIVKLEERTQKAERLLPKLQNSLSTRTESEVAEKLGITPQAITHWKRNRLGLSSLQVANFIKKTRKQAVSDSQSILIKPIVEFYPITKIKAGKDYELFTYDASAKKYPRELNGYLKEAVGLYIFYDSRGRALYVGETTAQNLWKEMCLAFNRRRKGQDITRVTHPINNIVFKTANEKERKLKDANLRLHELASYFSAYEVDSDVIGKLEAFLIRVFPNDLLNSKMESIAKKNKKRKKRVRGVRS